MRDSTNAKHKLFIAALLLTLFAIPFAMQWRSVSQFDSKSLMAGGATIGIADSSVQSVPRVTNNTGQATTTAGTSFTGILVR